MNKNRLNRLEKSIGKQLQEESVAPAVWRPEGGRMAIRESDRRVFHYLKR
jgi:hypothetical protein